MPSESIEDYVEAIYVLKKKDKPYVTPGEIALFLGVKPPSVTEMLRKLASLGYIVYEKYRGAYLTPLGEELGRKVAKRHSVLKNFLVILGVDEETAEEDACRIEHVVTPETMNHLTKFVELVEALEETPRFIERFREYYETGTLPSHMKLKQIPGKGD